MRLQVRKIEHTGACHISHELAFSGREPVRAAKRDTTGHEAHGLDRQRLRESADVDGSAAALEAESRIGDIYPSERSTCASGRARAALSCRGGPGVRISGVKIFPEAREDRPPTQYPELGLAGLPARRARKARGKW